MSANRLQDELLRLASRIGAVEDERDRLNKLLKAERDALWLRDQEIKKLKEELAAFPLLPEHSPQGERNFSKGASDDEQVSDGG